MPDASSNDPTRGVIAGIDYGTVRIGVALSDSGRSIASPYETYTRRDPAADARWFRRLTEEMRVTLFVVGLPVHLDGNESQKSREARQFGAWLTAETGVPVEFYDERFSTAEAEQLLQGAQLTSKQRKARRDMLAAQIMLTGYLETGGHRGQEPGGLDD